MTLRWFRPCARLVWIESFISFPEMSVGSFPFEKGFFSGLIFCLSNWNLFCERFISIFSTYIDIGTYIHHGTWPDALVSIMPPALHTSLKYAFSYYVLFMIFLKKQDQSFNISLKLKISKLQSVGVLCLFWVSIKFSWAYSYIFSQ